MATAVETKITGVLSHVEALYRPGDRQMAIDLFEALGCAVYDTSTVSPAGSTYLSVHPNPDVRDHDNALYLSERPQEQAGIDEAVRDKLRSDADFKVQFEAYRNMALNRPYGLSHIAFRYPSYEVIEAVLAGFESRVPDALRSRFTLSVIRPGENEEIGSGSIQAFLYTDLAVAGVSAFGQIFELAAYENA